MIVSAVKQSNLKNKLIIFKQICQALLIHLTSAKSNQKLEEEKNTRSISNNSIG